MATELCASDHTTIVPDFLIVGAQKAGTTAAARNLALHPRVCMFTGVTQFGQKEIEFFNQHWELAPTWYASHFERHGGLNGEKTAELLHRTICHQRMYLVNPKFRLIVLLRSPIERAYSQWRMARFHKRDEIDSFELVVARELDLIGSETYRRSFYRCAPSGVSNWREGYVLKGMYAEQLESLYRWFPKTQVFIAVSEEMRANMARTYAQIFKFLELPSVQVAFAEHFVGPPGPPMLPQTLSLLEEIYRPANDRLYSLIGRRIGAWL